MTKSILKVIVLEKDLHITLMERSSYGVTFYMNDLTESITCR